MTKQPKPRPASRTLCLAGLTLLSACAGPAAKKPAPVAAAVVAPAPARPVSATTLLKDMADFLAAAPRFSMEVDSRYDVLQDTGQMLEFGEHRTILLIRPDRLRVESEQSDGDRNLVLYDGKDLTAFDPGRKVYARTAKPGGVDAALQFFVRDLRMRLPLALLLRSDLPQELEERTGEVDYVERTRVDGQPAHHIAGRTETVDYQFWIAEGAQPLPLRVVLTYRNVEGHPQYRGQFSHWNLAPTVTDADFAFTPPDGAQKIAFLAELAAAQKPETPAQDAGAQP